MKESPKLFNARIVIICASITVALVAASIAVTSAIYQRQSRYPVLYFPKGNSHPNYFSVHNISGAWSFNQGEGVHVGILDHSFGHEEFPEMYAGYQNFVSPDFRFGNGSPHHGHWMACTLKEIAPNASVHALNTYTTDEAERVRAMSDAITWAIEHDLDILTYSAARISESGREYLQPFLDRAYAEGLCTIFLHHPDSRNLLVSKIEPPISEAQNQPLIEVYSYDYSRVRVEPYLDWMETGLEIDYIPFLSVSSKPVVAAGTVAMMISANPRLSRTDIFNILSSTRSPYEDYSTYINNALDASEAVSMASSF